LTSKEKNDIITDTSIIKAQEKVNELKQVEKLCVYDKGKSSHIRHVKEILGVDEVDDVAWNEYERIATEFLKRDIDGKKMKGFLSKSGWLFKFEPSTGRIAILSDKGTISTFFVPDRKSPEEYWEE